MSTTAHRHEVLAPPAGPWFRRHPRLALVTAVVLFAAVLALRLGVEDPLDAISMLYVFPVALLAMARGRLVGLLAGGVAVALVALWAVLASVDLSLVGWAARVLPLLLVGLLIGDASDQLERAARDRESYRLAVERHREAVEINDTLVQGMSAAKWALEADRTEAGLRALEETVELGHQLVSDLIRRSESELGTRSRGD